MRYLFVSALSDALWSVTMDIATPSGVEWKELTPSNINNNISTILDEYTGFGDPKLFIVSCGLDCFTEILKQVGPEVEERKPYMYGYLTLYPNTFNSKLDEI